MEEVIARLLTMNNATISAAESCTGGLLAQRLTSIAGSSSYFLGGAVCYSNELKTAWASVPAEMIQAKGAVSSEVAVALAIGIRRSVGSTLGVGITGIAGPTGGLPGKPVGLVFIALSARDAERVERFVWDSNREGNKARSADAALVLLKEFLEQSSDG